ncbi:MAG: aminotransferase class V-fold PLP-dependent enzyme [Candidatus Marinimicrobia bacterium]|jgi:selenocysteine lyase/cysteine desulfurase|nr:aminotransferase class V-fold PLP-dependent enzyme [Candidatus Neomarinimicrobiota bacterium]HJM46433.1 aminotransferase class V-fold PLP-dependent enzyme [Candidatus Neomarinimicrobiota bacterium]|tara:strand:+ start:2950 stop:4422 length:1473 start_codon:yes stop_codon:yes gene_type:complete
MNNLEKIKADFIGLNTTYSTVNKKEIRRVYLDSTASTLMMKAAYKAMESFYDHYANTHSLLYFSAKISTREYQWAHDRVLSFLKADPENYTCFFTGSGTTAGINRLARVFRDYRPERNKVLVSLMEHHSNDLPHRKHAEEVIHIPLDNFGREAGCINLEEIEKHLKRNESKINYVAVTGVSNVTGIINPIYDIAELAHSHGALIIVDGAQMVSHLPVTISGHKNPDRNLDAFVFSGHKTYVPGSPGVVVCRKDILMSIEPEEVGGGMVDRVFVDRYEVTKKFPDREEAGTPNIPGAIGLAAVLEVLDKAGMDVIHNEETDLINYALTELKKIPEIHIYGETDIDLCPRAGSISFNVIGVDHGLTAAILNDYFNIAVRNECFCAHPYVKEMIIDDLLDFTSELGEDNFEEEVFLKSGMVRASVGLYNTQEDIDTLVSALKEIISNTDELCSHYKTDSLGNYFHSSFDSDSFNMFSTASFIQLYWDTHSPSD